MSQKQVNGFHLQVLEEDLEIVRKLLRNHFGVEAEIKPKYQTPSLQAIFYMVAKALNAQVVVDLGTGSGVSCEAFAFALRETGGVVYTVDLYPDNVNVRNAINRFAEHKDPVIFIHGDSVQVGNSWDKGSIDVLLCDSAHSDQHVLNELDTWGRFTPKIILIHDTLTGDPQYSVGATNEPYSAAKKFAEKTGKTFINLNFGTGLGILI